MLEDSERIIIAKRCGELVWSVMQNEELEEGWEPVEQINGTSSFPRELLLSRSRHEHSADELTGLLMELYQYPVLHSLIDGLNSPASIRPMEYAGSAAIDTLKVQFYNRCDMRR